MGQSPHGFFRLCRICGAGEILTAVSGARSITLPALQEILLHRREQTRRHAYAAHLIWLLGAQLYTLGGGEDYPVPGFYDLFPEEGSPRDCRSAGDIRRSLLARLNHSIEKEDDHG